MSTANKDLFVRDPTQTTIPNDGVAKVMHPESPQEWEVLEWELRSFVCEGEYERGLERILSSYLSNLGGTVQPPAWVSGFYGSGKSHLARVLEFLWRDPTLPSGASARSLVHLPDDVADHLRELSIQAQRGGGLWSAAGTLGAGASESARLAFLSILFESAGLPRQYPLARFWMWATEEGYLDALRAAVKSAGKSLEHEVENLYVSPIIGQALLDRDQTLGNSVKDVRDLLTAQFPPRSSDVTDEEMFSAMDKVLHLKSTTDGKLPQTLVVLDEMQQYLGDDAERTLAVQNIVEGCASRFGCSVLVVATGQSALGATPTLQKLTDRFSIQVALSDTDVESVVRRVVLEKRPERREELDARLEKLRGEIDRQLGGTKLGAVASDSRDLAPDYPLLPTRRRFWDRALRAIDRAGRAGVLRTQLRMSHEAARAVAGEPVGHVVGGDFIYEQQSPGMLQSGVLLKEIDELIRGLEGEGPDGRLKSRACALVFLISKLPTGAAGDTGLRATTSYLADLLVEDLAADGTTVRARLPDLLGELVHAGKLVLIDDEYRLQTEEGAEWETDYLGRMSVARDDPTRMSQLRSEWLSRIVEEHLAGLRPVHGESKTPRRLRLYWGSEEPAADDGEIPVWVQDEWSISESAVRATAAEAGENSPIVFAFLPRREADRIRDALASWVAARDTVDQRATPQTDEGRDALRAMQTRVQLDEERVSRLLQDVVAGGRVFQGGGAELTTRTLRLSVEAAVERSLVRLFPEFADGDSTHWDKVVTKAHSGDPNALESVGWQRDAAEQPVCRKVLALVPAGGAKGADLQKHFGGPPYGWPKDAVNGAVLALMLAGNIRAAQDGLPVEDPTGLAPSLIGRATLYKEDQPPTAQERAAVKGLLVAGGIRYENNREQQQISALLQHLKDLAAGAGGTPPLPEVPATGHLDALAAEAGNQQFRMVAEAFEQLRDDLDEWQAANDRRAVREAEWARAKRFIQHAAGLPAARDAEEALQAIERGRLLLDEPDPLAPVLDQLTVTLRKEFSDRAEELSSARERAQAELQQLADWDRLGSEQQDAILREAGATSPIEVDVSNVERLLDALDQLPLATLRERIDLIPARLDRARAAVATALEPESITVRPATETIRSREDLEDYLTKVRRSVEPLLDDGKTVVI